jgi:hypothetical protein
VFQFIDDLACFFISFVLAMSIRHTILGHS